MVEILGYMLAAYAVWRMLDVLATEGTSSFRILLGVLGIVAIGLCVFLLTSQGEEVRRQLPDSILPR